MAPLSWLRHPLGFGKAKEERETALKNLTQELEETKANLERTTAELEQSKADLEASQTSASQLKTSEAELRKSLQHSGTQSIQLANEHHLALTKIDEELKIERATNTGARSELVRKDRMLSRIQAIWDEEVYGTTPVAQDTQTDGMLSDQAKATTTGAPAGLAYVSVILDADTDDYMFPHNLRQQREKGGELAGQLLYQEVRRYVQTQPGIPPNYELKVQMVLNLGSATNYRGQSYFPASMKGFLKCNALFDVIDSGEGKETADHKIRAKLRMDLNIRDCCLVIFGGCHDSGYIPVLREFVTDGVTRAKLRLLLPEHCFFMYEYFDLKWAEFPAIFPRCRYAYIDKDGKLQKTGGLSDPVQTKGHGPTVMIGPSQDAETIKAQISNTLSQKAYDLRLTQQTLSLPINNSTLDVADFSVSSGGSETFVDEAVKIALPIGVFDDSLPAIIDTLEPGPYKYAVKRVADQLKALAELQVAEYGEYQGKIREARDETAACKLELKKLELQTSWTKITLELATGAWKQQQATAKAKAEEAESALATTKPELDQHFLMSGRTATALQVISHDSEIFRPEPYVSVLVDVDAKCYHPPDFGHNAGKRFAAAIISDVHTSLDSMGVSVDYQNIKVELFYNETGATRQFGTTLKACLEEFAKAHPLFRLCNAGGHKEAADHMIIGTMRHELSQKNCAAIFLCVGHDGGYFAALQPLDLVSSAHHRIFLVEPRDGIWAAAYKNLNLNITRIKFSKAFGPVIKTAETLQAQSGVAHPAHTTLNNNHDNQDAKDVAVASVEKNNVKSATEQTEEPFGDSQAVAVSTNPASTLHAETISPLQSSVKASGVVGWLYSSILPAAKQALTAPAATPSTTPTASEIPPRTAPATEGSVTNGQVNKGPSTKPPLPGPNPPIVPPTNREQTSAATTKPLATRFKQLPNDFGSSNALDLGFANAYLFQTEGKLPIAGCRDIESIGRWMVIDKNGNRLDKLDFRAENAKFYDDLDRLCPVIFFTGSCALDNSYHLRERHDAEDTMTGDKWKAYRFFAACKPCDKGPSCRDRWCYRGHHPRHLCDDEHYKVKWVVKNGLAEDVREKMGKALETARFELLDKELVWLEKR